MGKWSGVSDGEPWEVQIEVDRFTDAEPFVVSIFTKHTDDEGTNETIACPSSAQARQMAAQLLGYANQCDRENHRVAASGDKDELG